MHADGAISLAGWEGMLVCGSGHGTIGVWELETGALAATLAGHSDFVCGLLVRGARLFSASTDGTIRAWAVGTWAAAASVEAYDGWSWGQYLRCLAASGPKLVSGSVGSGDAQREVRVWDLGSLACEQTVRQPAGAEVWCLLAAAGGEVWGGVGAEVVVWGRE